MGGNADACQSTTATQPTVTPNMCPAGWRLPTGASGGELQTLNNAVNFGSTPPTADAGLLSDWLNVYAGDYAGAGGLANQGSFGTYWSSTVNSATNAYYAHLTNTAVAPGTGAIQKVYGFSLRCVR